MKRVVFDLDETICVHENRDYANAAPVERTIARMREFRANCPECEIVILTARGMKSCEGDAQKADAKNRAVTEDWLKRHGVPYDRLVFGKPFADAYIDDKAVTLEDWMQFGYSKMAGYSGKPLHAIGRIVVKDDPDHAQRDWYEEAERLNIRTLLRPRVISWSFGRLFLRRVLGENLSDADESVVFSTIPLLHTAIREMARATDDEPNDVERYCELCRVRGTMAGMSQDACRSMCGDVLALKDTLSKRTFCHGDFTTMNIVASGNRLYLLDPSVKPFFGTYLLDAAKFRASLRGLEAILTGSGHDYGNALAYWDSLWTDEEMTAIQVLEHTLIVRVAGLAFKKGDDSRGNALLYLAGEKRYDA